jgi:hypothetical protein
MITPSWDPDWLPAARAEPESVWANIVEALTGARGAETAGDAGWWLATLIVVDRDRWLSRAVELAAHDDQWATLLFDALDNIEPGCAARQIYELLGRDRVIHRYVRYEKFLSHWAWEVVTDGAADDPPGDDGRWQLILDLIDACPDDEALAYVAAGPLEDFVEGDGDDHWRDVIGRIDAALDLQPRLRSALTHVCLGESPPAWALTRLDEITGGIRRPRSGWST